MYNLWGELLMSLQNRITKLYKTRNSYNMFSKVFSLLEGILTHKKLLTTKKYNIPKFPETIIIGPTNYCNHKCIMCPNRFLKNRGYMNFKLYIKILREVVKYKQYTKRISFGLFGEPLLHPKIKEMINLAKKEGFKTVLGTNASLLTKELAKEILPNLDEVRVSLYAYDKDSYRIIQGHDSSFFISTLDNINYLIEQSENFNINVRITFIPMEYNKRNWRKYFSQFRKSKNLDFDIVRLHNWYDINKLDNIKKESLFPLRYFKPCIQIEKTICIDWNGDVKVCCYAWDRKELNLGNVHNNTIFRLFNGDKLNKLRKMHETGEATNLLVCNNCAAHKYEMNFFDTVKYIYLKAKIKRFLKKFN